MNLPSPETMLAYASILEKPQYHIDKAGLKWLLPTGEIVEAACEALRYCADDGHRNLNEAEDEIERLNSRIVELLRERDNARKVLQNIADQMLTDEIEYSSGDFEGAYDIMIKLTRAALGAKP